MFKHKLRKKLLKSRKKKFNKNLKINFQKIDLLIRKSNIKNPVVGGYFPVNYEIDCLEILENLEKKNLKYVFLK